MRHPLRYNLELVALLLLAQMCAHAHVHGGGVVAVSCCGQMFTAYRLVACPAGSVLTCVRCAGQTSVMAAGQVIQIGMLTILTYAVELLLERGIVFAVASILAQMIQGAQPATHSISESYHWYVDRYHLLAWIRFSAPFSLGRGAIVTYAPAVACIILLFTYSCSCRFW